MTAQQETRLNRLAHLKSYRALSQPVQIALRLHLINGIELEEALAIQEVANIARTVESPKVQAVLKDMAPTVDDIMANPEFGAVKPAPPPPEIPSGQGGTGPVAAPEPKPAPPAVIPPVPAIPRAAWGNPCVPGCVCETCHGKAVAFLDASAFCADCFRTAYWQRESTKTASPDPDPTASLDDLGAEMRRRDAALTSEIQAHIEASPHATMDKVFLPGQDVPPEVLAVHPRARMATRAENDEAWQQHDQEQANEREALVSEYLRQQTAANEERARKIQQGWRF